MAGGNAIRGTRVGAGPIGESARGRVVPRPQIRSYCSQGHESAPRFAVDAVVPEQWDCTRCGLPASQDADNPPPPPTNEPFKTHLAYVKERRSQSDGEALLSEALKALRQRRSL